MKTLNAFLSVFIIIIVNVKNSNVFLFFLLVEKIIISFYTYTNILHHKKSYTQKNLKRCFFSLLFNLYILSKKNFQVGHSNRKCNSLNEILHPLFKDNIIIVGNTK